MSKSLKDPKAFRVFFSSPFKGMEEEREELTKRYFPEIQHKCSEMGLQFVPVDMRWGISVESANQAQTLNICLREIDRSDMFVGFFGQRYGWCGTEDALLQENIDNAVGKYPWLDGVRDRSVTEVEFIHGHLNNPGEMPSVICFRNKGYDDVMKDYRKSQAFNYQVKDDKAAEKLDQLKQRCQATEAQALAVHMDYPNPLEGARLMYDAIMGYLNNNVLKASGEESRRDVESAPHNVFAISRTSLYVRNQESSVLDQALAAVQPDGEAPSACPHVLVSGQAGSGKSALLSCWLQDHVSQQADVLAIPYYIGCAPSTRDPEELLGFVYGELDHHLGLGDKPEDAVKELEDPAKKDKSASDDGSVATSNQQTGDHANAESIAGNSAAKKVDKGEKAEESAANKSLKPVGDEEDAKQKEKVDKGENSEADAADKSSKSGGDKDDTKKEKVDKGEESEKDAADKSSKAGDEENAKKKGEARPKGRELQHQVLKKLEQLVKTGRRIVLVIDAVNRLVAANKTSKNLHWLPETFPTGVLCVVSTDDEDTDSIKKLHEELGYQVLRMEPLSESARLDICVESLKRSGKELSKEQLERIIKANKTENPLFLKIVLAELSVFGYFRKLDQKIDSLIQASSTKELIDSCLGRLEADYNVSSEQGHNIVSEVLKAIYVSVGGLSESEIISCFQITSEVWSPFFFAMDFYLVSNLGNLGFAFGAFRDAVQERYLCKEEAVGKSRQKLITYFDGIRKRQLLPWVIEKGPNAKYLSHAMLELVSLQQLQGEKEGVIRSITDLSVFKLLNSNHDLELLAAWQWTGMKGSEFCNRLMSAVDTAIADTYLATQDGKLDTDKSPGVRMRSAIAHMRSFFDLVNYRPGEERSLQREIRILEGASGKMDEDKRVEFLRDARYYLACNYSCNDNYKAAKALHESNLAEFRSAVAEKEDEELRKQIAYTQNGLGLVCMNTGDFDKAIEYLNESVAFHSDKKDHKNEGAGYTNLGLVYMYKQQFKKALELYEKAREAYDSGLFGQMSMDVGNLYTNIGLCHRRMKNLDKAEENYLKSLEIKTNAVGWDHLVVATALMNLGTLEMHRSHYEKSEAWTRKAIAVYQANEMVVTSKAYRRCRENLFCCLMKQGKREEILPFFIEIFDILNQHGWLEECLAVHHRRMIEYMVTNKPELVEKAGEMTKALIDSPKAHPDNYIQLIDVLKALPPDQRAELPHCYTLEACMESFPAHPCFNKVVKAKLAHHLLPEDDRPGITALIQCLAASYTDQNYGVRMSEMTEYAKEKEITKLWIECLKCLVEEDSTNTKMLRLWLRACLTLDQPDLAFLSVDAFLESHKQEGRDVSPQNIHPRLLKLDLAKILVARATDTDKALARQLLLLVISAGTRDDLRTEAETILKTLPEDRVDDSKAAVTSAA